MDRYTVQIAVAISGKQSNHKQTKPKPNTNKAVATSVVTTMCIQKRTEMDQYTIHWLIPDSCAVIPSEVVRLEPYPPTISQIWARSPASLQTMMCFWCLFFVGLCFCVFCCFGCCLFVCCVSEWNRDGCWTTYRSHTSSLLRPPTNGGYLYALIS